MKKNELRIFVPSSVKTDSSLVDNAQKNALDTWAEVSTLMDDAKVRKRAEEFVKRCKGLGAFRTDPGCEVDLLDDNRVMFDWNNGKFPILTALVSEDTITFVAKFAEGKTAGEDSTSTMVALKAVLSRLVEEIGDSAWQNMQVIRPVTEMIPVGNWLVLSSRATSGEEMGEQLFSSLRKTGNFQSTPQAAVSLARTSKKQAYMLPN